MEVDIEVGAQRRAEDPAAPVALAAVPELEPRARVRPEQYDTLALLLLAATPVPQIAEALGVPEASVKYYASKKSEAFNAVFAGYREQAVRRAVHHMERLGGLLEKAYRAIETALESTRDDIQSRKLAADTAFKLMDRAIPQRQNSDLKIEVTQQNIQVTQEVRQTFGVVMEKFANLIDVALTQDPRKHVREGDAALPAAYIERREAAETIDLNDPD